MSSPCPCHPHPVCSSLSWLALNFTPNSHPQIHFITLSQRLISDRWCGSPTSRRPPLSKFGSSQRRVADLFARRSVVRRSPAWLQEGRKRMQAVVWLEYTPTPTTALVCPFNDRMLVTCMSASTRTHDTMRISARILYWASKYCRDLERNDRRVMMAICSSTSDSPGRKAPFNTICHTWVQSTTR